MKSLFARFIVAAAVVGSVCLPAKALTVSATISTATVNTPGGMLYLNKNESLTYTLTGTATGQIILEKSNDGTHFATTGISVTATGAPSTTGTQYSGDKITWFRWRASTMTAGQTGTFVTTLYDNDDVVQEFKNNKGIPIVVITDDGISISGTVTASSATIGAATLNLAPVLSTPTLTNPTFSGSITTAAGSTTTTNGTRLDNSTGTWTGGQTFSSATISNLRVRGTTTNDSAVTGFVGEFVSSCSATLTAFPSSTQFGDGAQIALTAGDWDLSARMDFSQQGSTYTSMNLGISSTTGNSSAGLTLGDTRLNVGFGNAPWVSLPSNFAMTVPPVRVSLTALTTYYMKTGSTYSVGNPQFRGCIQGRRTR